MSSDDEDIKGQTIPTEMVSAALASLAPLVSILPIPTVLPGLEYLVPLDQVFVKQHIELLEIISGYETNNKYSVIDQTGREIYRVTENTDFCTRNCCGSARPFQIVIQGLEGHPIILERRLASSSCCCPCWLQKLKVYCPPTQLIGTVEQEWSFCSSKFVVYNEEGRVVSRIKGPCCTTRGCCCTSDVEFPICSPDGLAQVGGIAKKWGGYVHEMISDADTFCIVFPPGQDSKDKAVLIGACILIDFMFFESSGNRPLHQHY